MALVELPPAVLNRLMDLVDRQSLLCCSLSSRVLRPPCQKMLFSTLSYFFSLGELSRISERWRQFCEALNTTSDLGQHVKSLTVRAILLTDETTFSVFSKTVNLSTLVIEGEMMTRNNHTQMPWLNLQPQTRRLLLEDVFPRLTALRLPNLEGVPAILIESLTSVEQLECTDHLMPLPEDFSPPAHQSIERQHPLRRLNLTQSRNFNQVIDYTPLANYLRRHRSQIREISLSHIAINKKAMDQSTLSSLVELFAGSVTSLQALSFSGPDSFITHVRDKSSYKKWFNGIYNLSQYPVLTTFIINFLLEDPDEMKITITQYIQRIVDILHSGRPTASSAGLRVVAINAEFEAGVGNQASWWRPIVRALSTIPTLQKIFFHIYVFTFEDDRSRDIHIASKNVLEEALKDVGLLEKSEIGLGDDAVQWDLSIHSSLT